MRDKNNELQESESQCIEKDTECDTMFFINECSEFPMRIRLIDTLSICKNYVTYKSITVIVLIILLLITACATVSVRQQDLDAWKGQPVSALEKHPIFVTMPVVRTETSDGTEIWNYVNGRNVATCFSGGNFYGRTIDFATYSQFSNCMQNVQACNNIFYVKDGIVQSYTPIGSGGMLCYTDERLQPKFNEPTNYR